MMKVLFCERGDVFVLVDNKLAWSPYGSEADAERLMLAQQDKAVVATAVSLVDAVLTLGRFTPNADMLTEWRHQLSIADNALIRRGTL